MHIFRFINDKLETIKFTNKTKLLVTIMLGGTITIGFLMFLAVFALKYDYETLFQKHTQSQLRLEEIKEAYKVNIAETLQDIKQNHIDTKDGIEVITLTQQIIADQWDMYKKSSNTQTQRTSYFTNKLLAFFLLPAQVPEKAMFQQGIVDNIDAKMEHINTQINTVLGFLTQNKNKELFWMLDAIVLETTSLNNHLSNLISSHLKQSITEKQNNDKLFQTSAYILSSLIALVFCFVAFIVFMIVNHFKNLHHYLEDKVLQKTKELRALNNSLEKRIKKEVESNRKKDNLMFQQARLASLGEMLQNIAHQWRQPLGSLMMIIQGFESKFMAGKLNENFVTSRAKDAQILSQNMSDTLEDFTTFFNPNKSKNNFSIKEVVQKSIDLSKYQLNQEAISLHFIIKEDIEIFGFKNELIHVLLNLITNSKDVLCEKSELSEKIIHIIVKQGKETIFITVIDNGGGIKNDIIPRVFDPYFTTKHKSVGTGIGLYMSKQIVEKHMNGKITCKNIRHKLGGKEFYACTSFTIAIPKSNEANDGQTKS